MFKELVKKNNPELYTLLRSLYRKTVSKYYERKGERNVEKNLAKIYKKNTGKILDLKNPKTYSEKMQWAKLYEQDPLKTTLSDKYEVRKWVADQIGEEFLIPILGVWNDFDSINFEDLPNEFVLKTNHGSGTNIVVQNKEKLKIKKSKRLFNIWLNTNFAYVSAYEMQYKNIKPKIFAEKLLKDKEGTLKDYKFLCFNGKVYYCWVISDSRDDFIRNIYDINWQLQDWNFYIFEKKEKAIMPKPKGFDQMVNIASQLSADFSHVRVDLYNLDGKIYFGEMTFTNGSGLRKIKPEVYDKVLGDLWIFKE